MYTIDVSKTWLDNNALSKTEEDKLIGALKTESKFMKDHYGLKFLRSLNDDDALKSIPSRGSEKTLYHELVHCDTCKSLPGIGRYPVDALGVCFVNGKWYSNAVKKIEINLNDAKKQAVVIKKSLISLLAYIEKNKKASDNKSFYEGLSTVYKKVKSNIGIKIKSTLIEKYLSYLYPQLFPPFYVGDWHEVILGDDYDKSDEIMNYYLIRLKMDASKLNPIVFGERIWNFYPCVKENEYKKIGNAIIEKYGQGSHDLKTLTGEIKTTIDGLKGIGEDAKRSGAKVLRNLPNVFPGSFNVDNIANTLVITDNSSLIVPAKTKSASGLLISSLKNSFDLYYGIPGCGKSFKVDQIVHSEYDIFIRTVFHQEYTNSDFVAQYIPSNDSKSPIDIKPGPFARALAEALLHPDKKIALVIEEINRGNAAAIFGEVFQLLDMDYDKKRSRFPLFSPILSEYLLKECHTVYKDIYLPVNLSIIGTMNTSDQNVYKFDAAFKRRWKMIRITNNSSGFDKSKDDFIVPNIGDDVLWSTFVKKINIEIINNGLEEDRQLGYWFYKKDDGLDAESFGCKVLEYLWNDVTKYNHDILFESGINSFDSLLDKYFKKENIFKLDF